MGLARRAREETIMSKPDASLDELLHKVRDAGALDDNNGGEDWTHSDKEIAETKAAILDWVERENTQLQIDDRLVMLGWMEANKDNLKVSEIIATLKGQIEELEAEQRRKLRGGEDV